MISRNLREAIREKYHHQNPDILEGFLPNQLKIYANQAAYKAKKQCSPRLSLNELDAQATLIVEVPQPQSKRQKTAWTTIELDPAASTLPHVNDCQPAMWNLDATVISGFGMYCSSDKLMLFRRTDVVKLFDFMRYDVLRDGQCGYVLGPPGSGKSATAVAFALALTRTRWIVTWIHLGRRDPPVCVRLERSMKKTTTLDERYLADGDLKLILGEVEDTKKHLVFLDGVTMNNGAEEMLCRGWLQNNRVNHRLIVVTSMSFRGKTNMDEDAAMNVREHFVSSWTLNEYFTAVEDDELFRTVQPQLDSSDDSEPAAADLNESVGASDDSEPAAADLNESVEASDHDALAAADLKKLLRQSLVRSKYYFAGASARYMFGYPTAQVVSALEVAVSALWDVSSTAAGTVGDRSGGAVNRLFCRFRNNRQPGIISRYAGSAIAMFGGPALIKRHASVLEEDSNAAMDGWILEMYFFACVRKGGVTLYDGDKMIRWSQGEFLVVDPRNLPELPIAGWLKPHKYNQGGYDAIYIDRAQELVRFVHVTRAHRHTFHIRYFHQFLCSLRDSVSSFEVSTLEIFFVIEREALSDFKLSKVTGQGLLAAFDGWEKYKEQDKTRRAGIQGVNSWNEFDW
ncbi:unnamed protein product [Phytophthora lilii]|uniref:Unnamed protein product n=1 Tax=Phytophthora lilii TaxID=2077276 RepID=A0A9W7CUD9_9STRA|nr:unnamed protein product [Phytophthora lilii]